MKVLIIGAGRRGLRIAQHLVSEGASIVFLDRNAARCQIAEAKLDCLAVNGSGTDLEKLRDAGAETVDTVISATDSDEVNIVSCGIIASAFPNVENTTAVIRSSGYLGDQELPHKILGITHLINPDLEGALRIVDTVRYGLYQDTIIFPGTDFILFTVPEGVGLIRSGSRLSDLRKNLPYDFVKLVDPRQNVAGKGGRQDARLPALLDESTRTGNRFKNAVLHQCLNDGLDMSIGYPGFFRQAPCSGQTVSPLELSAFEKIQQIFFDSDMLIFHETAFCLPFIISY